MDVYYYQRLPAVNRAEWQQEKIPYVLRKKERMWRNWRFKNREVRERKTA